MPRGKSSPLGTETTNANGYTQVKVANGKWIGKHVIIAQERLGRTLLPGERAIFKDGNKENLDPENIEVVSTGTRKSIKAKIAKLQSEIEDRQAVIESLELELASSEENNE